MATYKVKCVTLKEHSLHDDCRAIAKIGFAGQNKDTLTKTPEEVHDWITDDDVTVVVDHGRERKKVFRAENNGRKYVRTASNDTPDDSLLHQPECDIDDAADE